MSARTRRRRRCSGPCGGLFPPERLSRVGGRAALCPDCLLLEAEKLGVHAGAAEALELGVAEQGVEPAPEPPEPLPLRDEEERFAGMVERDVPGWPLVRGRLSATSLATFLRCPEQFRRQYVLGEKRPSSGVSLAGTGAHAAVEAAARLQAERGLVASSKQVVDTYHASFEEAVARAADREGIVWGVAEKKELDLDSSRRLGQKAVEAYADEIPLLDAVEVERVFVFDVAGVAVPICGLIDVAGKRSTTDLKFGGSVASSVRPGWRVQALIYGLAARLPVDFHATSWAGKVQTQRSHPGLRYAWDAREAVVAARVIRGVVAAILLYAERFESAPWPGNLTHTWACDRCEFRPDCSWWNVEASDLL